jgi:hypothetical protein
LTILQEVNTFPKLNSKLLYVKTKKEGKIGIVCL